MFDGGQALASEPVPEKELAGTKELYATGFWFRARASTPGGPARAGPPPGRRLPLVRALPEKVRSVTPADVQKFAIRYARNMQTTYLGDPDGLRRRAHPLS